MTHDCHADAGLNTFNGGYSKDNHIVTQSDSRDCNGF